MEAKKGQEEEGRHMRPRDVRMMLSKSHNPAEDILQFQKDNALKIGDSEVAVQFLDMLGVPRSQLCRNLLDDLKTHLKGLLLDLDDPNKIENLLSACFGFIKDEDLGEIARLCLERSNTLPPSVLNAVVRSRDMDLLERLPKKLQRQVMEENIEERAKKRRKMDNDTLSFLEQRVAESINTYVTTQTFANAADETGFVGRFPTNVRRDKMKKSLDELSLELGNPLSVSLCAATIHFLAREYFHGAKTKNSSSYASTLLADIMITVHPTQELADANLPLAKALRHLETLAKKLDDCVKKNKIDEQRILEIHTVICKALGLVKDKASAVSSIAGTVTHSEVDAESLKRVLRIGLKKFSKRDHMQLFRAPVTEDVAPNYFSVISKPICLADMRHKINVSEYSNLGQFEADLMLMLENCRKYNKEGHQYYDYATKLMNYASSNLIKKLLKELPPPPAGQPQAPAPVSPLPSTVLKLLAPLSSSHSALEAKSVSLLIKGIVMLLADPFILKIMAHQASDIIAEAARQQDYNGLPTHRTLHLILQLMEIANMPIHNLDDQTKVSLPECDQKLLHKYLPGIAKFSHEVLDKPPPPDAEEHPPAANELKTLIKTDWGKPFQSSYNLCKIVQIMLCTELRKASCYKVSTLLLMIAVSLRKRKELYYYRPFWFSLASAVVAVKKENKLSCELLTMVIKFFITFFYKSSIDSSIHEQFIRLLGDLMKCLEESKAKNDDSNAPALSEIVEHETKEIINYWLRAQSNGTITSVQEALDQEKMKKIKSVYNQRFFKSFPAVKEKLGL